MSEQKQPPSASDDVLVTAIDLADVATSLSAEAGFSATGRASRLIVQGPHQRAVVMAFDAGSGLDDHDPPRAATVHVLVGEVDFVVGDKSWRLTAGQLISIPPVRHSLAAAEPAVVMLTVTL